MSASPHLPQSTPPSTPPLEHTYVAAVPELSTAWRARPVSESRLLVLNEPLAAELGLDPAWLRSDEGLQFLTGNVPDSVPTYAQAYSGHQFGHYSPRLGDGRALLLGELLNPTGQRRDLHLKGSGRTPFARGGDGLAAVGPMLREYLISEAMHALGIPTTRSLAVVATGETVYRETPLPGAVLARVAASHLRVGTVQYASALGHAPVLRRLVEYAIDRHHPHVRENAGDGDERAPQRALGLLEAVCAVQAETIARWMGAGFIHGVMNTDNTTLSGETIDYGPCAFIDAHNPATVFSSIDHGGRYSYGNQPAVGQWNLARFAEALLPLIAGSDPEQAHLDAAVEQATQVLQGYAARYEKALAAEMARRFGLPHAEGPAQLVVNRGLLLMESESVDHTQFLRGLATGTARDLVNDVEAFDAWNEMRQGLQPDPAAAAEQLLAVNPVYIPRNHVVEDALTAATSGDLAPFERLLEALKDPYTERPGLDDLASPAPADAPRHVTYCGT